MNTDYGAGDEEARRAGDHSTGPTLISWQHGGSPTRQGVPVGDTETAVDWPDDRFDLVWTFTKTADGWQFAQVPELVLPGDQDTVIEN
jgi:hypothetical protein